MFPTLYTRFDDCSESRCLVSPSALDESSFRLPQDVFFVKRKNVFPNHNCSRFVRWFNQLKDPIAPDMFLPNSVYRSRFLGQNEQDGEATGDEQQVPAKKWVPWWTNRIRNKRHAQLAVERFDAGEWTDDVDTLDDPKFGDNNEGDDDDSVMAGDELEELRRQVDLGDGDQDEQGAEFAAGERDVYRVDSEWAKTPPSAPTPLIISRPVSMRVRSGAKTMMTPKSAVVINLSDQAMQETKVRTKNKTNQQTVVKQTTHNDGPSRNNNSKSRNRQTAARTDTLPVLKRGDSRLAKVEMVAPSSSTAGPNEQEVKKTIAFPARLYTTKSKSYKTYGKHGNKAEGTEHQEDPDQLHQVASDRVVITGEDSVDVSSNIVEVGSASVSINEPATNRGGKSHDATPFELAPSSRISTPSSSVSHLVMLMEDQIAEFVPEPKTPKPSSGAASRHLQALNDQRQLAIPQVSITTAAQRQAEEQTRLEKEKQEEQVEEPPPQQEPQPQPQQQHQQSHRLTPKTPSLSLLPRDYRKYQRMSSKSHNKAMSASSSSPTKEPIVSNKEIAEKQVEKTKTPPPSNIVTTLTVPSTQTKLPSAGGRKIAFAGGVVSDTKAGSFKGSNQPNIYFFSTAASSDTGVSLRTTSDISGLTNMTSYSSGIGTDIDLSPITRSQTSLRETKGSALAVATPALPTIVDEPAKVSPRDSVAEASNAQTPHDESALSREATAASFSAMVERSRNKRVRLLLPELSSGASGCAGLSHVFHEPRPLGGNGSPWHGQTPRAGRFSSITEQLLRYYKKTEERRLQRETSFMYHP